MKAYKKFSKYSPFYLKNHPEDSTEGDITHIQKMSEQVSGTNGELTGIESVFEKNLGQFNMLMSKSDPGQQLQLAQDTVSKNMKK